MQRWVIESAVRVLVAWLAVSVVLAPLYAIYGGAPIWGLYWGWLGPVALIAVRIAERVQLRAQQRRAEPDPWAAHEQENTLWWEEPHDPEPPDRAA